jgi:hypothetical protein
MGTTESFGGPAPGRKLSPASAPATASLAAGGWPEPVNDLPGWPEARTTLSDWPELAVSPDGPESPDSPDGPAEGAGQQEPSAGSSSSGTVFAGTVFAAAAESLAIPGAITGEANKSTPRADTPAGTAAIAWSASGAGADVREPAGTGADLDEDDLPRRVRQANLAPQLRDSQVRPPSLPDVAIQTTRSPEETRVTMSAIQRGWERGRSVFDASGTDEPASAAVTPEAATASAANSTADTATPADTAPADTATADTATADAGTADAAPADTATTDAAAADTATGRANGDSAASGTHRSDD